MLSGTPTPKTRIIGAAALALAATALLAPVASGKPTPRIYPPVNQLGSQLDRLQDQPKQATIVASPDAFERAVAIHQAQLANVPDAFERAVAVHRQQLANVSPDAFERAVAAHQSTLAQQPRVTAAVDDGGSVDWGLVGALSGLAAVCIALAGATVVFARQRERTAHP
jgi:hypothetical protein